MATEIEQVIDDSRRYLGCVPPDATPGLDRADWLNISRFAEATGDENPIYVDPQYAAHSCHATMLAPSAFVLSVQKPGSAGTLDQVSNALTDMLASLQVVWDDEVRLADRLRGSTMLTDVDEAADWQGGQAVRIRSTTSYARGASWFAHAHAQVMIYSLLAVEERFAGRTLHRYSPAEIAQLEQALDSEPAPRGGVARMWSATMIGEALPELIKGPLTFSDLFAWKAAEGRPLRAGRLAHHDLAGLPGRCAVNPLTHWPVWDRTEAWEDLDAAGAAGLPAPGAGGSQLFALASQFVNHWMGDDAFLRRLRIEVQQPLFFGDALTLRGSIVDRFLVEDERQRLFHAVRIRIEGPNQLGEAVLGGEATVLLQEPGRPVSLPIRGGLKLVHREPE